MGADMYFNPPTETISVWESVQRLEHELSACKHENRLLVQINRDKSAQIEALRTALKVLGGKLIDDQLPAPGDC